MLKRAVWIPSAALTWAQVDAKMSKIAGWKWNVPQSTVLLTPDATDISFHVPYRDLRNTVAAWWEIKLTETSDGGDTKYIPGIWLQVWSWTKPLGSDQLKVFVSGWMNVHIQACQTERAKHWKGKDANRLFSPHSETCQSANRLWLLLLRRYLSPFERQPLSFAQYLQLRITFATKLPSCGPALSQPFPPQPPLRRGDNGDG